MTATYKPPVVIYYGPIDSAHKLIPSPNINISIQYNYSNDTIIGYTYIIDLNGTVTALDLRQLQYDEQYPDLNNINYNIGAVTDHLYKLRQILSQNGNILQIVNFNDNGSSTTILRAKSGILRSFNINESPNNWGQTATYSASLEFTSVDIYDGHNEGCSSLFLDSDGYPKDLKGIVDIDRFKLKEFNDSWSFNFANPEIYSKVRTNEFGTDLNFNNTSFTITYNISATGKHYYIYDDEATGERKLIPAWEQAKNFVQERLYYQVSNLINGILSNQQYSSGDSAACGTGSNTLKYLHDPTTNEDGLLSNLGDNEFKVFNETIVCETSESDGTFSATYNAIVKTTKGNLLFSLPEANHTVTKTVNRTRNGNSINHSISVNGNIQGLVEGGLIRNTGPINLPANGTFFITGTIDSNNKYYNAKLLLDKIYDSSLYSGGIGNTGKKDLKPNFKALLGINITELGMPDLNADDDVSDPPHPTSFNLTHDYHNGTINYSLEYNSSALLGRKYREISIQTTDKTKVIASFNIPNSQSCPLVQDIGTYTAKTVNITVNGVDFKYNLDSLNLIAEIESESPCEEGYLPIAVPNEDGMIKTAQSFNHNIVDGSWTLNLTYICGTQGCTI